MLRPTHWDPAQRTPWGEVRPEYLRRPVPLAFLDDGRRLFLLIDAGRGRTADQPRSWGVEIVTDGDLVGENAGGQTAIRSTGRLTPQAAAHAASYVLSATA